MPEISVIIPNWNGLRWLPDCLAALRTQSFRDFETVLVDNGSTDGSPEWVRQNAPEVRIIELGRNTGFAGAVNAGIRATAAPLVALLNTDTRVDSAWLSALRNALAAADGRVGAVCGKLLCMDRPDRIENAGDTLSWQGAAEKRGHGESSDRWDAPGEIFSVCAGAVLYRRAFFDAVGLFDESFFAYLEDVDLGLRGRLRGWTFRYEPRALALHEGHGSGLPSARYVRLITANRIRLLLKNLPGRMLFRHAGALLYGQFYFGLLYRQPGAVLAGYADVLRDARALRAARREQRAARSCPDSEIERWIAPRMSAPGLLEAARRRLATEPARGKPARRILHLTVPPEAIPGTDATLQDAALLARELGAEILHVYPGRRPSRWMPPILFGWNVWNALREADRAGAVHLVFHSRARAFPYLRFLRGHVIYTVTADAGRAEPPGWLRRRAIFVVTQARAARSAGTWRNARVVEIRPGVDLSHIRTAPPPAPETPPTLLMASAPWTRSQFRSKGIVLLLDVLRLRPDLRLILLWRGWHLEPLRRLVANTGFADRVEIVDRRVDVNEYLARSHAVVLLARSSRLVKAWPHSLLEGLAAGRPVLASSAIPISDELRERDLGEVLEDWTPESLNAAICRLLRRTGRFDVRAAFSPERMVEAYRTLLERPSAPPSGSHERAIAFVNRAG